MKIALAQLNPTIGDFEGNARRIFDAAGRAVAAGAELMVTPELCIMGYPPRDLVERKAFVEEGLRAVEQLARRLPLPALIGFVSRNESSEGKPLCNSAAFLRDGKIVSVYNKLLLPTYDVFDEDRYFEPGREPGMIEIGGRLFGVTICEDLWRPRAGFQARYHFDPVEALREKGVSALLNLSASPFTLGKMAQRRQLLADHAKSLRAPLIYVNQAGGNDELLFDGGSMVANAQGEIVAMARTFQEDLIVVDLDALPPPMTISDPPVPERAFRALVMGTRDYLRKCGFSQAVLGLSGGIDSALTAVIAVEALGNQNVLGVSMPSRFSSDHSRGDAEVLARNLGMRYHVLPIETVHKAYLDTLSPVFQGLHEDITEENLQPRIRGALLMALSNKFGSLVLTTGNKSELACGYCTLYGDMCGGLAPIGDVPKMMVYEIARWVNREREIIPENTITKPPSAELKPNQTDQDTLPPYDQLDRVLHAYIEEQMDPEEIIASGVKAEIVHDVVRRIETAEYKRRQAVTCLKITSKAFGYGRRVPIAKKAPPTI
jgi:NAD+ synthetase